MRRITLGLLAMTSLSGCFQATSISQGDIARQSTRTGQVVAALKEEGKASFQVSADSSDSITIDAPESDGVSGTSLTIEAGTLKVSTSILIETGVTLSETSVTSEIALSSDVAIQNASRGVIVRPSESVDLQKPLELRLPLPTGTSLNLASSSSYAIYYKWFEPSTGALMSGMLPVDGTIASFVYDERLKSDLVNFKGYFGSYWVVQLSRALASTEVPTAVASEEPIVNKNQTTVIAKSGILAETAVVTAQKQTKAEILKPVISLDGRRAVLKITEDSRLSNCFADFFESTSDINGYSTATGKTFSASYLPNKITAFNLFGRYRCVDENQNRITSPWSDAISIPSYSFAKALKVESPATDGLYGIGTEILIRVTFSDLVTVTGQPRLELVTGVSGRSAAYRSGSGTNMLEFAFTVANNDDSSDLHVKAILLTSNDAVLDRNGLPANLTLPAATDTNSLAGSRAIAVDGKAPSAPDSVGFASAATTQTSLPLSWTASSDSHLAQYSAKLCEANDCATGCLSAQTSTTTSTNLTGVLDKIYFGCVQAQDALGNLSAWSSSTNAIIVDGGAPTVSMVTSSKANGSYSVGQTIEIQVVFSETVYVSNGSSMALLLETGTTDRSATYASGSGSNTLNFSYTVQANDTSSDLDYQSTGALTLGSATLADAAGNSALLTLPSPGGSNSLSGQKAIVIDTIAPSAPTISSPTANALLAAALPTVTGVADSGLLIKIYEGTTLLGSATSASGSFSITLSTALSDGSHTIIAKAYDAASNATASSNVTFSIDTIAPTLPSSVGFASSQTNATSFNISWTNSTDMNFSTHNAKICSASDCSTGCLSPISAATSPQTMTGASNQTYYGCVQGLDLAGHASAWVASFNAITVDTISPTIISVTSPIADSYFKAGDVIPITVIFSEPVVATNSSGISLLLETGSLDREASYVAGSGTNILQFQYIVQSGDTSSDLEYHSTSALTLAGSSIADYAGNSASILLPTIGSGNSLAGSKAIVIDTTPPASPSITSPTGSTSTTVISTVTGSSEALNHIDVYLDSALVASTTADGAGNWSLALPSALVSGSHALYATARDQAGNMSAAGAIVNFTVSLPVPIVNAGADRSVNATTSLSASVYYAVSQQWTKVSGPGSVTFGSPTSSTTTFTAATEGVYVLRLTAKNAANVESYDELVLTYDTTPPIFSGVTRTEQVSETSVRVFWTGATDALSPSESIVYEICYSTTSNACLPASFTSLINTSSNTWEAVLSSLTSGSVYEIMVRAIDPAGNISYGGGVKHNGGLRDIKEIAGKNASRCFLLNSGTVHCTGENTSYQLGQGGSGTTGSQIPLLVPGLTGVKSISGGMNHYCAIMSDDTVKCWGDNTNGQLGDGTNTNRSTPQTVTGLANVQQLALGSNYSCALTSGSVSCWGLNSSGQLGNGSNTSSTTPVSTTGISTATSISSGTAFSCAILADKTAKCWGAGASGQLGNNSTTNQSSPVTTGIGNVEQLALGEAFACARVTAGGAYCWGAGGSGALGQNSSSNLTAPTIISSLSTSVTNLVAGLNWACATKNDGTNMCWGANLYGQFGYGPNFSNQMIPTTIASLTNATNFSANWYSQCAKFPGNIWKCWGRNESGEAGTGAITSSQSPVNVALSSTASAVASGASHSCALLSDGSVRCWGANGFGQIGSSAVFGTNYNEHEAQAFSLGGTATKIFAGANHSCAILSDSSVRCWGKNDFGQLGNAGSTNSYLPQTVVTTSGSGTLTGVVDLALGENTSCAVLSDNSLRCWGSALNGLLGNSQSSGLSSIPVDSSAFSSIPVQQVAIGANHLCALGTDANKTVYCLGLNGNYQLGDGTTTSSLVPHSILTGALSISAFGDNTCAHLSDGTVKCWGPNALGQLGNGTFAVSSLPQIVSGISDASEVKVGNGFACASLASGQMKCWGDDDDGRLANSLAGSGNVSTPTRVSGLSLATSNFSLGSGHSCAILSDGRLVCWGLNGNRQLGLANGIGWLTRPELAVSN